MNFDQHVHPELDGTGLEIARQNIVQRRHDEKDAVGAEGARFDDLQRVDHEILAKNRKSDRIARRDEIFRRALEPLPVRQHGQAGGAAVLIGLCQHLGIEILADQTFRRRCLLQLGNQAVAGLRGGFQCLREATNGRGGPCRCHQVDTRCGIAERRHFLALAVDDLCQHVFHRVRHFPFRCW